MAKAGTKGFWDQAAKDIGAISGGIQYAIGQANGSGTVSAPAASSSSADMGTVFGIPTTYVALGAAGLLAVVLLKR